MNALPLRISLFAGFLGHCKTRHLSCVLAKSRQVFSQIAADMARRKH
jgi:hypothetical protein